MTIYFKIFLNYIVIIFHNVTTLLKHKSFLFTVILITKMQSWGAKESSFKNIKNTAKHKPEQ